MSLAEQFPPLYECSVCGSAVKVRPQGLGVEPIKAFKCEHTEAPIWANRKVTLRGKGTLVPVHARMTLTIRQLLSLLTGRSI